MSDLKSTLLAGAAVALAMSSVAAAQTASQPEAVEEVVVTGYRAASRAAVAAKQNAAVVLDAVSQDDIGRLPDLNIVEASRRITGLSVVGGIDATKNRDIYQRAAIRGLDPKYNLVTIDGAPIASGDWSFRGARLDMLPSTLVARIEAIKTVTAEFDPHALGGQLNIVSKSAFDQRSGRFLAMNASIGANSTSGKLVESQKGSYRADATASTIFGDADQFGFIVSAEVQRLPSTAKAELPGDTFGAGWTYFTAAGARTPFAKLSTGILSPVREQDYRFDNVRSRASLNAKLEYRPNERARASLFAGYYYDKDVETRFEALTQPSGGPTNVTATSGSFALGDLQQGLTYQPVERGTYFVNAKAGYDFTDKLTADISVASSDAKYRENRHMIKWDSAPRAGTSVGNGYIAAFAHSYAIVDGAPRVTFASPATVNNLDSYRVVYYRDINRDLDSRTDHVQGALSYNAKSEDRGLGFMLGGALTRTDLNFNVRYKEWNAATVAAQNLIGSPASIIYDQRPDTYETPGVPYFLINREAAWKLFHANPTAFVATNQALNNAADDYNDIETTRAVWAKLLYRTDRLTLQAGLRQDSTDLTVRTNQAPVVTGGPYTRLERKSDYDFLLPSVLASYQINDEMRVRLGVSKTIGRPDYSQYAARTTFNLATDGSLTINTGNPDLKPREAVNYDASYEWFMGHGGLFSAAAFVKTIKNEIFTSARMGEPTLFNGVTYDRVTVTQPQNAADAQVRGLEFSYTQDRFDFLPDALSGVGVNANFTLLDGHFDQSMSAASIANGGSAKRRTSGLIQQPDYIANLTLFYVKGPFEGRVSYNRIGKALQSADADVSWRDLYQTARSQLDLQASYAIRSDFSVVAQVQNVTTEPFIVKQGEQRELLNYYFPVGRTFWFGLSWKPKF